MSRNQRIAVALSGGVDSATTAALLLEQGWEVIGLTMQLWDQNESNPGGNRSCCAPEDAQDARRAAETLGIPFYVLDMEADFHASVISDFIGAYGAGRTPNPCIRCNERLKFDLLLHKARQLEAEALATGHYAIIRPGVGGRPHLLRGRDRGKDQSYFLFPVKTEQLKRLRFPLGDMTKEETRALAERHGLHLARKRESQDLCFIPDQDIHGFFARHAPHLLTPGDIVHLDGEVLGRHKGLACYTIGQRRGLGVGGGAPVYVNAIDARRNRLVVGPEQALYKRSLVVEEVNWLAAEALTSPSRIEARIRYAAEPKPAIAEPLGESRIQVRFDQPQRAITPGQACVFHQGDRILGGGWIL